MARVHMFPGSFDPLTAGHIDIALRALQACDVLIVTVGINSSKRARFPVAHRMVLLKRAFAGHPQIKITHFEGTLASHARHHGVCMIVRGSRNMPEYLKEPLQALSWDCQAKRNTFDLDGDDGRL